MQLEYWLFETSAKREPQLRVCERCGASFQQSKPRGRPQRYCSAECRDTERREMIAEWFRANKSKSNPDRECRHCGRIFSTPPRSQGRLPHWCSPQCKQATQRGVKPPSEPPALDLFTHLNPEG